MTKTDKPLLFLIDDDETFCDVLKQALLKRGFDVYTAHSVTQAMALLEDHIPQYAIVDLNMPQQSGLKLIPKLKESNHAIKMVVLTGYASIATAVEAIKLGASNYLTKPSDADEIVHALNNNDVELTSVAPMQPMTTDRLEWEHIQKVLKDCDGNISRAARQLGLHRRTLQRKLQKRPSKLD